jgi:pre-60S factor REI1
MAATTTPGLASQTGSFSCITCHMLFTDGAAQRDHYKAEVHRFNLKRKVAGLAPVTADVYDAKQKGT